MNAKEIAKAVGYKESELWSDLEYSDREFLEFERIGRDIFHIYESKIYDENGNVLLTATYKRKVIEEDWWTGETLYDDQAEEIDFRIGA